MENCAVPNHQDWAQESNLQSTLINRRDEVRLSEAEYIAIFKRAELGFPTIGAPAQLFSLFCLRLLSIFLFCPAKVLEDCELSY
jgi:hypothetical protein